MQKNNMWTRNSRYFTRFSPQWWATATGKQFYLDSLKVTPVENEENLILQKEQCLCYLHSTFDTDREMREMFKGAGQSDQVLIVFGLGMGKCLDYIREHHIEYKKVQIFEPFNNIIRETLKYRDLASLLSLPNVSISIISEAKDVAEFLFMEVLYSSNIKVLYHLSYRSIFPELFDEINRLLSSRINSLRTSVVTMETFLFLWTRNQIYSLGCGDRSASLLYNKFNKVPAILVSAGPSLERQLQTLAGIGDQALIMAPGSSGRILSRRGIDPHLVMAMDAEKVEVELYNDFCGSSLLIGSYRLDPEMDQVFPNGILRFINSNERIAQYFFDYRNDPGEVINDYSSVATSALEYLIKLGCDPIIIIGQDMCYYQDKLHADEAPGSLPDEARRTFRDAVDMNGNPVFTDNAFLAMQHDMERLHNQFNGSVTIINCTEAGLGIPGMREMSFREAVGEYVEGHPRDVRILLDELPGEESSLKADFRQEVIGFYHHLLSELKCLEDLNQEKLEALRVLNTSVKKGQQSKRLIKEFESITQINKKLLDKPIYYSVVMGGLQQILVYYRAAAHHSKRDISTVDPESEMYYETMVYDFTSRYISFIRSTIEKFLEQEANTGESQ